MTPILVPSCTQREHTPYFTELDTEITDFYKSKREITSRRMRLLTFTTRLLGKMGSYLAAEEVGHG